MTNPLKSSFASILIVCFMLGSAFPLGASAVEKPKDIIAKVGDQDITFSQIEIMINSSDMVGMPVPTPGTPQRNEARLLVLDKVISANLLYLDALKKGVQNDPAYQRDVEGFSRAMLAEQYREKKVTDIKVTDEEVRDYYKNQIEPGTPFTPEVRIAVESRIRKDRFKEKQAALQKQLRQGVDVSIDQTKLDSKGDAARAGSEVVARIGTETVTWGELKSALPNAGKGTAEAVKMETLNTIIDEHIAENKAKAAGLDRDPKYLGQVGEFKKVHLISVYKTKLFPGMEPTDREVKEYFEKNKGKIQVPEARKIQMVVLKTKAEAEDIKKKIKSGELTIYEAVTKYSIDPNAKLTLGEFGWVDKGTGFPELDKLTFSLKPDELGGPVESPAGWHLVKVLEARKARLQNISDKDTLTTTRNMIMREKFDQYVVSLRTQKVFPVEVYDKTLERIIKQEDEKVKAAREKAEKTPPTAQELPGKSGIKQK
jgi:parvulin-like peptidyl-prolyl isomerase